MADKKISDLTALTGANVADTDLLPIVDTSATETKKITFGEFKTALDTSTGFVRITGDTMTGDLSFGDNNKAIFGAGDDLEIYHDGSNSIIKDGGTGDLQIRAANFKLNNAEYTTTMLEAYVGGAVSLWYDNAAKLATTATGIDVTGTVAAGAGTALLPSITTTGDLNTGMWFPAADTIAFSEGGVEALRIDSSGNLLVGQTVGNVYNQSSVTGLKLEGAGGNIQTARANNVSLLLNRYGTDGAIASFYKDGTTVGSIGAVDSDLYLGSVGSVGLRFNDATNKIVPVNNVGANRDNAIDLGQSDSRFKDLYLSGGVSNPAAGGTLTFGTVGSERMRIGSTGTVTVGKTAEDIGTAGHAFAAQGYAFHTRSGATPLFINRLTSDGTLAEFRKDGTTVGSIGAVDSDLYLGSVGSVGLRFNDATNKIVPVNNVGANRDNAIDLGQSDSRFKDLYLSGGVSNPAAGGTLTFGTVGSERMRITSGGTLQIAGGGNDNVGEINMGNTAQNASRFQVRHQSSAWYLKTVDSEPLILGTANTERLRIDSTGNLLVGATSGAKHTISKSVASGGVLEIINTSGTAPSGTAFLLTGAAPNNGTSTFFTTSDTSAYRGGWLSNGGVQNYQANNSNLSDRREKTNFSPAKSYLNTICNIPVQTFNYIDQNMEDDDSVSLGVVAQDLQATAPELVVESNWGTEEEPKMRLSIYQTDLQYALMKCIQEQQAIITAMETRLSALEG
jgi:uncharacterized protein YaiE (UPF0345 family)